MGLPNDQLLQGAGAVAPIAGGFLQARDARDAARGRERAALANAAEARRQASDAATRTRRQGKLDLSRARLRVAQGGTEATGSTLEFLATQAAEIERNAVNQLVTGERNVALDTARAENERSAGRRRSASALLLGTAQAGQNVLRQRGFL